MIIVVVVVSEYLLRVCLSPERGSFDFDASRGGEATFNKKTVQKRRDLHPQKFNAFNSEQREKVVESKTPGCYHYRREKEEEEEEVSVKQSHNAPDITSCLRLLPREREEKREKERKRIVTERID